MSQHSTNHTGDPGDTLEEDEPGQPFLLRHNELGRELLAGLWVLVSGDEVHAPSEEANCAQGGPVRPVGGFAVCNLHLLHLVFGITGLVISCCHQNGMGDRVSTYTGCCHAEPTSSTPEASGGGKYSLIRFWGVLWMRRLVGLMSDEPSLRLRDVLWRVDAAVPE